MESTKNALLLDHPDALALIFYPEKCSKTPLPAGAIDVSIEVEKDITLGCRFHVHDKSNPNILYFHGNGEQVCDHDAIGPMYGEVGLNLLVVDYRGYGWSNGTPTVSNMLSDADIVFEKSKKWLEENGCTGALFIMGRSLGSVPAINLAKNHDDFKGLLLESAIADTVPLAISLGLNFPQREICEENGFKNLQKIEKVTKPTFILHGARDELIPASEAEKLQAHSGARSKEFVVIPGAQHNSMITTGGKLYFETIKKFVDKFTGASNWRNRRKAMKAAKE